MRKSISLPNIQKTNLVTLKRNVSTNALDSIALEAILFNNTSIPQIVTCLSSNRFKSFDEEMAICLITPPEIHEETRFETKNLLVNDKEETKTRRLRRKENCNK